MPVKIDNKSYKIDDFEKKYSGFFAPTFDISVGGKKTNDSDVLINSVSVDTDTKKADYCSFTVVNAYDFENAEFKWVDDFFTPGKKIEVMMGYEDAKETVFEGIITSVLFNFPEDESPEVIVTGMDNSFKMMKGSKSFTWLKKKDSEVVSEIASKYVSNNTIDSTEAQKSEIIQNGESDYKFVQLLAEKNNFEFFITGTTLFFRKPHKSKTPVIEISKGRCLLRLDVKHDIGRQIGSVAVRGWDHKKKEEFEEKVQSIETLGSGKDGPSIIRSTAGSDKVEYIYSNEESKDNAKSRAEAVLGMHAMDLVSGEGECFGIPEIIAGKYLKLTGIAANLDKLYYIVSARHIINDNGYRTTFTLGGNDI
jgi:uncharacterized protein